VSTDRELEKIAANLDDMSVTLEEIKATTEESGSPDTKELAESHEDIERAADAIDDAVDPESR
jgi:hypothetical protein